MNEQFMFLAFLILTQAILRRNAAQFVLQNGFLQQICRNLCAKTVKNPGLHHYTRPK